MPYSSESTSASQEAAIRFSETPIEPHTSLPVGGVDQHARDRAGALRLIEDAHLEVDQLDVAQVRVDLADRLAQRAVERVHRAVALGGAHVALAAHPDLDRGLGLDLAVGALLDEHAPGLQAEQRLVLARLLAHQQLEGAVGGLELEALVLELLDALERRAGRDRSSRARSRPALGAFSTIVPLPESSEMSTSRLLPTTAGSMCSKVCASARTPAACRPGLVREGVLADVGLRGIGRAVEQLVDEVRRLGQARQALGGQQLGMPIFSCRSAMIVIRLALPVRSPMPLIVPCTCVAPASTAVSVLATAQPESSWVWMPSAHARQRFGDHREGRADLRRQRAAVGVAQHERARRPPRRRRAGSPARSRGRARSRRRSARRRAARACPRRRRKATESAIIARFSSRETRTTFSTCSTEALPTSVHTGAKQLGQDAQALVLLGARRRAGGSCRRRRSARRSSCSPASSSNSSCSLGLDAGKPASIMCTPSCVQRVHDAHLLLGGEAQAAAPHAVAQGGVV